MSAYRDAMTKNVKIQILSIYAYRYTMKLLRKFHEPYEKISLRQIKRARLHARKRGPGWNVPKVFSHRVRLDTSKVNHFIDFVNRPYFYQDVAFGTRTLTLHGGGKITMPNVIPGPWLDRPWLCSTLNIAKKNHLNRLAAQPFFPFLKWERLHRRSLSVVWTILQRRAASFERLLSILEELNQAGADKRRVTERWQKTPKDGV